MIKINTGRVFGVILVGALAIGLFLPILIQFYILKKTANYQPAVLRELSESEKNKLFLYEETLKAGLTFRDFALLKRIAFAESRFRHFDRNGDVIRGAINPLDTGIFQINKRWHSEAMKNMNLDIYDTKDNIRYAVWLYAREGSQPWAWSKKMWQK